MLDDRIAKFDLSTYHFRAFLWVLTTTYIIPTLIHRWWGRGSILNEKAWGFIAARQQYKMLITKPETRNQQLATSPPRPPVVVVLGHVDHGKTTILSQIRKTKVPKEAGGITQHIGAYQVESGGKKITFLDTPGHEAFSAIRSRGAKVADVAVLVVAADEGVKPQTKEAIQIIKQAEIPFVVAVNKTDKEGANPQRVKQELAENEVFVEDYGGQVPAAELSAKTGQGIEHLLELILLVTELEELTAVVEASAKGVVIESHLDSRRGLVATLIIEEGTLAVGDYISAGSAYGRVKLLEDFTGKSIKSASPSQPCLVLGWQLAPRLGQEFKVVASVKEAEQIAGESASLQPAAIFVQESSGTDRPRAEEPRVEPKKFANFIIKADVQSSLEAIDQVLKTIKSDEVGYKVVGYGVGNVIDTDIKNARATGASIVGFHVGVENSAKQSAERERVTVKTYDIIYELVEGARAIMSELLEPEIKRTTLGKVKVLALFKADAKFQIVGGKVVQGKVIRGALIDVGRNGVVVITGRLGQLQQNKADFPEVAEGLECGIRFDFIGKPTSQIAVGDVLEVYEEEKIKRSI